MLWKKKTGLLKREKEKRENEGKKEKTGETEYKNKYSFIIDKLFHIACLIDFFYFYLIHEARLLSPKDC